jgi:(4-(4-[2-(gamma-L-glutamylamino)ethyl]phenoxymethyl)furan-2-yl)methanamine synthase
MAGVAWTGLDVGGAHLKAARLDAAGRVTTAVQVPCALWQGMDRLERALDEALGADAAPGPAAATMTGELVDLFPDRAEGVARLVGCLSARFPDLRVWTAAGRLVAPGEALADPLGAASANWLATATLAARRLGEGMLVDIGSTTADLVPFAGGEVLARGLTDRERLASGELVYTGAVRTPLMAVAREVPFAGERVPLMAEHFATTADVWRLLGLLPEDSDQHPAADGGPKTIEGSARRLARMVGADLGDAPPAAWAEVARAFAREQEATLLRAARRQLSRGLLAGDAPVVATGGGAFIARRLAEALGRPCRDLASLVEAAPQAAAGVGRCAPAVAVALLARETAARTDRNEAGSIASSRRPPQSAPRKPR